MYWWTETAAPDYYSQQIVMIKETKQNKIEAERIHDH